MWDMLEQTNVYPIGTEISQVKLIEWVYNNLEDKFMYWRCQFWTLHVQLWSCGILLSSFATMVEESS